MKLGMEHNKMTPDLNFLLNKTNLLLEIRFRSLKVLSTAIVEFFVLTNRFALKAESFRRPFVALH